MLVGKYHDNVIHFVLTVLDDEATITFAFCFFFVFFCVVNSGYTIFSVFFPNSCFDLGFLLLSDWFF